MTGSRKRSLMSRREFLGTTSALALSAAYGAPASRKWPLGLNTYCLRFQRWKDRQLIDYCASTNILVEGTVNLRSCGRSANHISLLRHTRPGESRRRTRQKSPADCSS